MSEVPHLHINFARVDGIRLARGRCPDCEVGYRYGRRIVPPNPRRPFVVTWWQEWYGFNTTCLRCGCEWADGEILPRPFEPGWRSVNIAAASALWRKHRRREEAS